MSFDETDRPERAARVLAIHNTDDAVLTFSEWCRLNGFSPRTGRRILAGPKAQRPIITSLSPRRIGITRGNNRRWQESRAW